MYRYIFKTYGSFSRPYWCIDSFDTYTGGCIYIGTMILEYRYAFWTRRKSMAEVFVNVSIQGFYNLLTEDARGYAPSFVVGGVVFALLHKYGLWIYFCHALIPKSKSLNKEIKFSYREDLCTSRHQCQRHLQLSDANVFFHQTTVALAVVFTSSIHYYTWFPNSKCWVSQQLVHWPQWWNQNFSLGEGRGYKNFKCTGPYASEVR